MGSRGDDLALSGIGIGPVAAQDLARLFVGDLGDRWVHVQAVAAKAEALRGVFGGGDADVLVVAAWLHDIGYSGRLHQSGFHPLDGANHLHSIGETRLASLVAHHSGARFEAEARGLSSRLGRFARERTALAEALDWCDMTTDSTGQDVSIETRVERVLRRYGPAHPVSTGVRLALPQLRRSVARTERRIAAGG